MTEYLLSIDPGKSSGLALLAYDDDSAPVLEAAWQFGGGLAGVRSWLGKSVTPLRLSGTPFHGMAGVPRFTAGGITICEKFSPRPSNVTGFQQSLDTVEPLRVEGMLVDREIMPDYAPKVKTWRSPSQQYLVGGKDKADKKRRMHKFLKDNGYYRTGKDFGMADADDARSAIAHGINYLIREVKHGPSYQLVVDWLEKEGE